MTFTAPADATLAKETQYFVVFEETSDGRYYLVVRIHSHADSADGRGPGSVRFAVPGTRRTHAWFYTDSSGSPGTLLYTFG